MKRVAAGVVQHKKIGGQSWWRARTGTPRRR
jgi:hypothetical protein